MIKASLVGAAGYTAGELLRILVHHPEVEIAQLVSSSQAGKKVSDIHHDLLGSVELEFESSLSKPLDVLFLCQGHGQSISFLTKNTLEKRVKIIDLSQDFRHKSTSSFSGRNFTFGLPEVNKLEIAKADAVANPGCFATAIMLGLLPLAKSGLLKDEVHIHALTGSTGAGQRLSETSHFSYRNNNVSIYKPFEHQHLKEIKETLQTDVTLNFIPVRGNFSRGIFASLYMCAQSDLNAIKERYTDFYSSAPFVHISDKPVHLKQVVNTNHCIVHLDVIQEKLLVTSCIDNLVKGASGQAVQNMNLMFGLEEQTGLKLKGSFF